MRQSFKKKEPRKLLGAANAHVLMAMAELKSAGDSIAEINMLHAVSEMIVERLGTRTPRYAEWITRDLIVENLRALALDPNCSPALARDARQTADLLS